MGLRDFRRDRISKPIFSWAKGVMPPISETERSAIDAGSVWFDGEIFSGNPDWKGLLAMKPASLSAEERAFLDGPTRELCAMVDDWKLNWENRDLPPEVWDFMRKNKFFGMIIPKEYGGLGFSNTAHSEVVRLLSSVSVVAGVTVMVPNSLGPGELLLEFGTKEQRDHWLPRLADGREIPCFGLTSPDAGSDAAAMKDTGIVEHGEFNGERVLGIRLNFEKRYITLGPVATVMGVAFQLLDPDNHLGGGKKRGITVALLPTDTPGVSHGDRHIPLFTHFQNGPLYGKDVFVPLDHVLGGPERIGQGWMMLMTALAAGRGISLPSQSAASAAACARATGAYARVRRQFGVPIGKFEGIQVPLAEICANAYLIDAARRLTVAALDEGHKPSVISAIMKYHATERMRRSVEHAMDIHGGKGIIEGPKNYLASAYRSVPIGITVEGANILTRNLMIFGQGAIRSHPHMLDELLALSEEDREAGLDEFDRHFWRHVGHSIRNTGRSFLRGWTGGLVAPAPVDAAMAPHWRQLSRYSAAFALLSDLSLLTLGGALKRKEMISARLGDIVSEIYLLAAALKRFEDEGRHEEDRPILDYLMITGRERIAHAFEGVLQNLPARWAAAIVRLLAFPAGFSRREPKDELVTRLAEILMTPGTQRDRLTVDLYLGEGREDHPLSDLELAFELAVAAEPAEKKMREAKIEDVDAALAKGTINKDEADLLRRARDAHDRVVAVDAFPMEEISPISDQHRQPPSDGKTSAKAKKPAGQAPKRRKTVKNEPAKEAAE